VQHGWDFLSLTADFWHDSCGVRLERREQEYVASWIKARVAGGVVVYIEELSRDKRTRVDDLTDRGMSKALAGLSDVDTNLGLVEGRRYLGLGSPAGVGTKCRRNVKGYSVILRETLGSSELKQNGGRKSSNQMDSRHSAVL